MAAYKNLFWENLASPYESALLVPGLNNLFDL
jgi:hypothetical protein